MDLGAATHPGHVRSGNEDGYLALREQAVFAVADGMGGHAHGEVASHLALEAINDFAETIANTSPGELATVLHDAIQAANASIFAQAKEQDARTRMGTTLVLATISGDRLYFAHIGDSRLYLVRGGLFTQLTRDHSVVQTLLDRGEISPEEAAIHPLRHQITRVVGGDERVSPEIASQSLESGDILLLCTDGLSGVVSNDAIHATLSSSKSAQDKADALIQQALDAGGPDNITAVVVEYQEALLKQPTPQPQVTAAKNTSWVRMVLLWLVGALALIGASGAWVYHHPQYVVAVDGQDIIRLYRERPLLPFIPRELVPTPDVPQVTETEAKPYLVQYQPQGGSMEDGIPVKDKDEGVALLGTIAKVTAAGLLEQARQAIDRNQLTAARASLSRARALHADPMMVNQLAAQLDVRARQQSVHE